VPPSEVASELGRQLQKLRKTPARGGSKPRIEHNAEVPIGSRKTRDGQYICVCVECRRARGQLSKVPTGRPKGFAAMSERKANQIRSVGGKTRARNQSRAERQAVARKGGLAKARSMKGDA
jgi:hypothetical protein